MLVLVVAAVFAMTWYEYRMRQRGRDLPARIVALAARWIPPERREWARALAAELDAVRSGPARWAYAVAALRMGALPPARRPRQQASAALLGAVVTAGVSTAAVLVVPTIAPFVVTLAVLLAGLASRRAGRSIPRAMTLAHRTVVGVAVTGLVATVAVICAVTVVHPSATGDRAHIVSTLLALALTSYLGVALHEPTRHADTIRYSATAGAIGLVGATAVTAMTGPDQVGVSPMLSLPGIGVCLAVAGGVAIGVGDVAAARRAGMLTAILAAPLQFAVTTISLLTVHDWSSIGALDQIAYRRSGYPDLASYAISDAMGGQIIAGVLIGPLILGVVAWVGAAAAMGLRRP
jgi:hypothetical protein